jgi:proline iminopeptidase
MPAYIVRALERCEKSYRPRPLPPPGAEAALAVTQQTIDLQAQRMKAAFPFLSHPLMARLASALSYLPPLRSTAYEILGIQFVIRHVYRRQPIPLGIFKMLAGVNGEIYETLWGPSEFFAPGLLKDWDIRPRLHEIQLPVLIISGQFDEATPAQMTNLRNGLSNAEQVSLDQSAHCGMWEEAVAYRSAIISFLGRVETADVEPAQRQKRA